MSFFKYKIFLLIIFFLSSCSSVPANTSNSCLIFDERYLWYKHAKKSEQKWGTPIYLQLAIIKMESGFDWFLDNGWNIKSVFSRIDKDGVGHENLIELRAVKSRQNLY